MKPAAVGLQDEGRRCWEEEADERRRCGVRLLLLPLLAQVAVAVATGRLPLEAPVM